MFSTAVSTCFACWTSAAAVAASRSPAVAEPEIRLRNPGSAAAATSGASSTVFSVRAISVRSVRRSSICFCIAVCRPSVTSPRELDRRLCVRVIASAAAFSSSFRLVVVFSTAVSTCFACAISDEAEVSSLIPVAVASDICVRNDLVAAIALSGAVFAVCSVRLTSVRRFFKVSICCSIAP